MNLQFKRHLYYFEHFFFLHISNSPDGIPEWGIIELQGDLESQDGESMDNEFIGDLSYDKYGQPVSLSAQ